MQSHYRGRDLDEYEEEDYDEYEEDGSEEEQEEEEVEPPSQEQQEFLKMREQLKEKFRQKLRNETSGGLGHRSQSQDKRRTTNDNFGSFFGPSQPVIASRVLEERRSIQATQHIMSRMTNASSGNAKDITHRSSEKKTVLHKQKPKVVNEVKKKVQTLKDMRDYSFLLSDDADFPDAKEERPARNVSASNSGFCSFWKMVVQLKHRRRVDHKLLSHKWLSLRGQSPMDMDQRILLLKTCYHRAE